MGQFHFSTFRELISTYDSLKLTIEMVLSLMRFKLGIIARRVAFLFYFINT